MTKIIIIGAGHAGGRLSQNLISSQYDCEIFLFGEEDYLPYERPPLSKAFLSGEKQIEDLYLEPKLSYKNPNLKIYLKNKIKKIDLEKKKITDSNNSSYSYDKIIFANGASPKKINSNNLNGIFYLRDIKDSMKIQSKISSSQNIVLLGAGYINLEIASTIRKNYSNKNISIVEFSSDILGRNSNIYIRNAIYNTHLKNNIHFYFNSTIKRFIGSSNVEKIILNNEDELLCDLLVVGIGVAPNLDLLLHTSIINENGIVVNEFCETKINDVYAIGDISLFKSNFFNKSVREESWNNAEKQSFIVSQNIIGNKCHYNEIPWFWTDQFENNFQILGEINEYDSIVDRFYDEKKSIKFFIKNNKVRGAFAINNGRDIKIAKQIILNDLDFEISKLEDINMNLKKIIK